MADARNFIKRVEVNGVFSHFIANYTIEKFEKEWTVEVELLLPENTPLQDLVAAADTKAGQWKAALTEPAEKLASVVENTAGEVTL